MIFRGRFYLQPQSCDHKQTQILNLVTKQSKLGSVSPLRIVTISCADCRLLCADGFEAIIELWNMCYYSNCLFKNVLIFSLIVATT